MTKKIEVRTKEQNNRLFQAGAYGCKLRSWRTWGDLARSDYRGPVVVRYLEPGSRWCRYDVPQEDVMEVVADWCLEGAQLSKFVFSEPAPDEDLLIQGELMWHEGGWYLFFSTEPTKMRTALKNGRHLRGYAVQAVLREYLTPSSYDDLMALFDTFKDPVVEFSTYRRTLGDIPGRNTLIWEVRSTY